MKTSRTKEPERVHLPELIGKGYGQFWRYKGRYRVVKGSRASKKSKTTALWIIASMMRYPEANTLVVRKVFRTLKDSCYTDLKWAVNRLKCAAWWDFKESPLEATYRPTGQKIFFRGLDDPLKIASISVPVGALCWMWLEEAYEVMKESDFDTLDESIRGETPDGLFKQITLTFNPWNERHWLKRRFFDAPDADTLAMTTNYLCNEWLDQADLALFENMKERNPRRYKVAGLGEWGIVEGVIYENWEEREYTLAGIREEHKDLQTVCGLDFGYTNDPSAFVIGFLSQADKTLYVWDEIYKTGLTNPDIVTEITAAGYRKETITADSAEPKSIAELRSLGLRVRPAVKGPDSIRHGIQFLQGFRMIIHPRCVNFETEISNYTWATDKTGNRLNVPIDEFNHLLDALRYATEKMAAGGVRYHGYKGGI